MKSMQDLLAAHPFFTGLDEAAMTLIAGCATNVHFPDGAYIFREGAPADTFYLIRHGRVALQVHEPARGRLLIDTIDDDEVLGWSWLVPPYRWFTDARAVTETSAIALDGACLRGKCEDDPALGYQLLQRVAGVMYQRLHATRMRVLDLYGGARV
ncbi:MAG TPA: cyclic nucleotide-binding domain-containing protein [Mycobacteriales bacterium]|nr:cyclic nucleotide-binding domain-containing protein [Mycobacteriales bacterium]